MFVIISKKFELGSVKPAIIKEPFEGSFLFLNDSALLACLGFAPRSQSSAIATQLQFAPSARYPD